MQAGPRSGPAPLLVSAKEAAELEELLGSFDMGIGDGEEFGARLQVGWGGRLAGESVGAYEKVCAAAGGRGWGCEGHMKG